jgi:hypothetical protein
MSRYIKCKLCLGVTLLLVSLVALCLRLSPICATALASGRTAASNRSAATTEPQKGIGDSVVALEMRPDPKGFPEREAWLVVSPKTGTTSKAVYSRRIGEGTGGTVTVGQLTGGQSQEVFVFVDGQRTYAEVLRLRGHKAQVLYELGGGRPKVFLRWNNRLDAYDVVEAWSGFQLGLPPNSPLKGSKIVLQVFRWDGHHYKLHHLEKGTAGDRASN